MSWFFMSYANRDNEGLDEPLVDVFYKDLNGYIQRLVEGSDKGFLDQFGLEIGDDWSRELAKEIRIGKTFIPLLTSRYLTRQYCGLEWGGFEQRLEKRGGAVPPLVLPVLWSVPVEPFPDWAMKGHVKVPSDRVPPEAKAAMNEYFDYGLIHIIDRRGSESYRLAYQTFLTYLSRRIVEVAGDHPLPELHEAELARLEDARQKFDLEPPGGVAQAGGAGPASVSSDAAFVFVVAGQEAMRAKRPEAARYYLSADVREWTPYAHKAGSRVGRLATEAVQQNERFIKWVDTTPALIEAIRELDRDNVPAVVLIDPWSARVGEIGAILDDLNAARFGNCVVLVVWDFVDNDPHRSAIEQLARRRLSNWFDTNSRFFKPTIFSAGELRQEMANALKEAMGRVVQRLEPSRPVDSGRYQVPPGL